MCVCVIYILQIISKFLFLDIYIYSGYEVANVDECIECVANTWYAGGLKAPPRPNNKTSFVITTGNLKFQSQKKIKIHLYDIKRDA